MAVNRDLVGFFATRAFGDVIAHEVIAALVNIPYPSHRYYGAIRDAAQFLENAHNRIIRVVTGRGYEIVYPHQRNEVAASQALMGVKRLERAGSIVGGTDLAAIPKSSRDTHVRATAALSVLTDETMVVVRDLRLLNRAKKPALVVVRENEQELIGISHEFERLWKKVGEKPAPLLMAEWSRLRLRLNKAERRQVDREALKPIFTLRDLVRERIAASPL